MMSRTLRALLVTGVSVAALAVGTSTAQANAITSRAAAEAPNYVRLQVEQSGQCLTIKDGTMQEGPYGVQSKCADELDYQLFELRPNGAAAFEIAAKHSGRCLSTGPDFEWKVGQRWCFDSSEHRYWRVQLVEVSKDLYELRPMEALNYCLSISGGSLEDGAFAHVGNCAGVPNQRWRILPASS
ncbi:RICIN domain-containing protein [Streptomyces orinoci]|uniref:RICIN domain-containing protein n=1 Tax=Streptomyces orinoci TaxID=67339 RepID=A0ABV3JTI6_STRON|nr:RICIN domain-containing protein [Streptomyces orinoci]